MIAFLTSIGEQTTALSKWQLERLGFAVICLDKDQSWIEKYREFIIQARKLNVPCLRLDADCIVNKSILDVWQNFVRSGGSVLMKQVHGYDLYRNNVGVVSPVLYKPDALRIIQENFHKLDAHRPETSAWRLPQINPRTATAPAVCSVHGFCQTWADLERHRATKKARGQMHEFDFEFAEKFLELQTKL